MEKKKLIITASSCAMFAAVVLAKSPVIMTVNGEDVTKSEFEYLYNKNGQQQLVQQPIGEYLEMFKLYKMKVADAKAAGIDTTAKFRKEINQYKHDLALPYLTDSTYLHKLLEETYSRSRQEAEAKHIMFFKNQDAETNGKYRQTLDSLRNQIIAGADFAEMARTYSQDRGSAAQGGSMGYITAQQYPYNFELAVYNTPEGEISEIVESPVGYHLIMGGKKRKARGKVKVAHILKLTQNLSTEDAEKAKVKIDSLYQQAISNPEEFENLAKDNSDDPGSARQGGVLPEFGTGEMVEQFDSAAFAIPDKSISKPFKTSYGWHIIKRLSASDAPGIEAMKPAFLSRVSNPQDERYAMIKNNQTEQLAKKHKGRINAKTVGVIKNMISENGLDSVAHVKLASVPYSDLEILKIGKKQYFVKDFAGRLVGFINSDPESGANIFMKSLDDYFNSELVAAEEDRLYNEVADYRNLLNEYTDGSLLYEISVEKVWDKAAQDVDGLEKYFENNRSGYKWSTPHAKGLLVQAKNDSIASEIRKVAKGLPDNELVNTLRKQFKGEASIEKVLVEKGANKMIDYLMFDGPEAKPSKAAYSVMFMLVPRILDAPENYKDVKGLVTNDYQNELQSIWEEELRSKYPVTLNEKVLKSFK